MENFHKIILRGIKTIYLIWSTLIRILYVQDTTLKVLLKLSTRTYHWSLKVAFLLLKPRLYLDNKGIAFKQFSGNDNC